MLPINYYLRFNVYCCTHCILMCLDRWIVVAKSTMLTTAAMSKISNQFEWFWWEKKIHKKSVTISELKTKSPYETNLKRWQPSGFQRFLMAYGWLVFVLLAVCKLECCFVGINRKIFITFGKHYLLSIEDSNAMVFKMKMSIFRFIHALYIYDTNYRVRQSYC